MKTRECRRKFYALPLLLSLLAVALIIGACTTPEKAKAQHVARGQALLKDKKFQEASLEFRAALQIDDRLADAHWGLANAFEGLQRYQEAFDEMKQMMHDHLNLTTAEVQARLKGDWAADIAAYERAHEQILHMADMLSAGIVSQFPQKFK